MGGFDAGDALGGGIQLCHDPPLLLNGRERDADTQNLVRSNGCVICRTPCLDLFLKSRVFGCPIEPARLNEGAVGSKQKIVTGNNSSLVLFRNNSETSNFRINLGDKKFVRFDRLLFFCFDLETSDLIAGNDALCSCLNCNAPVGRWIIDQEKL
ncbi:MAG: hypothetical protein WCS65_15645 [Verrucomicrobiae bacterium]